MRELKLDNINFSSDENGYIKVVNQSLDKLSIIFSDEVIKYNGYVNNDFKPGHWVMTNTNDWDYKSESKTIKIKITSPKQKYTVLYNIETKEFMDKTDNFVKVVDYKVINKKISILIAAHKSDLYIDETINSFIKILKNKQHLDVEIIILIDGCRDTLKHISKKVYPDFIKIYLSYENYGLSITKNTLVSLCKNERFIFFDSDDIPTNDLIDTVYDSLDENDIVYYNHYFFNDGDDYNVEKNLKTIDNHYMGGTFGMYKNKFLDINGFFPWRVQSDDEFKWRTNDIKKVKKKVLNEKLFIYRIRKDSLSKDKRTSDGGILRDTYKEIINDNIVNRSFKCPNDFKYNKDVIVIQ